MRRDTFAEFLTEIKWYAFQIILTIGFFIALFQIVEVAFVGLDLSG